MRPRPICCCNCVNLQHHLRVQTSMKVIITTSDARVKWVIFCVIVCVCVCACIDQRIRSRPAHPQLDGAETAGWTVQTMLLFHSQRYASRAADRCPHGADSEHFAYHTGECMSTLYRVWTLDGGHIAPPSYIIYIYIYIFTGLGLNDYFPNFQGNFASGSRTSSIRVQS